MLVKKFQEYYIALIHNFGTKLQFFGTKMIVLDERKFYFCILNFYKLKSIKYDKN